MFYDFNCQSKFLNWYFLEKYMGENDMISSAIYHEGGIFF